MFCAISIIGYRKMDRGVDSILLLDTYHKEIMDQNVSSWYMAHIVL